VRKKRGKIPTILDSVDELTRLVLINAIHFAADWKVPFKGNLTQENDFTLQDGTKVKTKLMQAFDGQKMYNDEGDTLGLELPYKTDGNGASASEGTVGLRKMGIGDDPPKTQSHSSVNEGNAGQCMHAKIQDGKQF